MSEQLLYLWCMQKNDPKAMKAYLEDITEDLNANAMIDQMEMYRMLTEIGNAMESIPEESKTDENFVQGCVSNVYVDDRLEDGCIWFRGSSESHIVRGYLAILVRALSGLTPQDLLAESEQPILKFAERTNIKASLTPNRANAFGNIYKLIRKKAEDNL